MMTIYACSDSLAADANNAKVAVLMEENEKENISLTETFINMRRNLRDDLKVENALPWSNPENSKLVF